MSNVVIMTTPQLLYKSNHHHRLFPSSLQTTNLKLEKYLNLAILEEDFWTIVYFAKHV
jgi:hypothetical protein